MRFGILTILAVVREDGQYRLLKPYFRVVNSQNFGTINYNVQNGSLLLRPDVKNGIHGFCRVEC